VYGSGGGYVIDTHTAVAYAAFEKYRKSAGDGTKTVIIATASPYKFAGDVCRALGEEGGVDTLEKLSGVRVPDAIKDIEKRPVLHKTVCEPEEMKDKVKIFLKLKEGIK